MTKKKAMIKKIKTIKRIKMTVHHLSTLKYLKKKNDNFMPSKVSHSI